jgi:hypothetical protein
MALLLFQPPFTGPQLVEFADPLDIRGRNRFVIVTPGQFQCFVHFVTPCFQNPVQSRKDVRLRDMG